MAESANFPTTPTKDPLSAAAISKYPNYVSDREVIKQFLTHFQHEVGCFKYLDLFNDIAHRRIITFPFSLDDVAIFGQLYLAQRIQMNVSGYMEEISRVVDELIPDITHHDDMIDQLSYDARLGREKLPPLLVRRYELMILPLSDYADPVPLRQLNGSCIGSLSVIRGICIAASAVRPRLHILTSVCELCTETTFQEVIGDRITPLVVCPSQRCRLNNAIGRLLPQYKASRFKKFQELKIQELPNDVPPGAIPRTIRVTCDGEQTKIATPGQMLRLIGALCPDPSTGQGHHAFRASTMVKVQFRAFHIELEKRTYQEAADDLSEQLEMVRAEGDIYQTIAKITRSIAPEIWGLEDVKKALLCLLVGGGSVTNGIKIRSDINMCLMGDPGVAKSQLLKWIVSVAPRSIFTTGKGSTGVGLTAAVSRDAQTGEVMLEGGALVLSDRGICCIDEFDKMDDSDRTALHEVMEQQAVSIAKAGIVTTLNARTSILAASNPKFGRWKRYATPSENINIPPALLSRFDLLWLLLDESNREHDLSLSSHVTCVHLDELDQNQPSQRSPSDSFFSKDFLRAYIGSAKKINPVIGSSAAKVISDIYCELRAQRARFTNVVTARTLLSLIRLSQACARLRFSENVEEADVQEASRLIDCSSASLHTTSDKKSGRYFPTSDASIFSCIKEISKDSQNISLSSVRTALLLKGVDESHLQRCLATYTEVGVLTVTGDLISFLGY